MDLKETYNLIAEHWHRDHSIDSWWIKGVNLFIKELPSGARVLDVGCGSGVKSKYLANHGLNVIGIDISEKLLDIARRGVPESEFRIHSMMELDSMNEIFDGVFAQASLIHIPKKDVGGVVKNMADKIGLAGVLYVAVKEAREGEPDEQTQKERDYGFEYERFFSFFNMPELERYFSDAGLQVVSKLRHQNKSNDTVWLQIIGKK